MNESANAKPRKRSPAYPSIGLKESIERANALYNEADEHFVPLETAAESWGYKIVGSSAAQIISALKQFGLLEEKGSKDKREVKLTELALDILVHQESSQERRDAIKKAALFPKIHRELWEKYEGRLPPNNTTIRVYLIRQREEGTFNRSHVEGFIEQFRATLAFAGLNGGNTIKEPESEDFTDDEEPNEGPDMPTATVPPPATKRQEPPTKPIHNLPQGNAGTLPEGENRDREQVVLAEGPVVIDRPANLSPESVDEFERWTNLAIQRARRKSGGQNLTRRLPTGEFIHLIKYPGSEAWRIRSFDRSWLSSDGTQLITATAYAEKNGWVDLEFATENEAVEFVKQVVAKK